MRTPQSVKALEELGRVRLSPSFFMRDFLYSDIAATFGLSNIPDDPDLAIRAGSKLCEVLLEPLQEQFGRVAVRSAYRSQEVNRRGNDMGLNCASNEANAAAHIWDLRDSDDHMGATACVVLPAFYDRHHKHGDWKKLAWWIHDHLPYSDLDFFKTYWAFNIRWYEKPVRRIHNWIETPRILTKPGMANHEGSHAEQWQEIAKPC